MNSECLVSNDPLLELYAEKIDVFFKHHSHGICMPMFCEFEDMRNEPRATGYGDPDGLFAYSPSYLAVCM